MASSKTISISRKRVLLVLCGLACYACHENFAVAKETKLLTLREEAPFAQAKPMVQEESTKKAD